MYEKRGPYSLSLKKLLMYMLNGVIGIREHHIYCFAMSENGVKKRTYYRGITI